MSNLRQAAEMALEALEWSKPHADASITYEEAISALIEALAEPPQKPICPECTAEVLYECVACSNNNYPPQRLPLTEEEIKELWVVYRAALPRYLCFARALERAHGIGEKHE